MLMVLALALTTVGGRAAWAQEPAGPPDADDPELWSALEDDPPPGPMMEHGPMGHGPMMGHAGRMGAGMGPGMDMHGALMRALDLTPEQRERMAAARDRQARKAIQARADLALAQLDLHKLMRQEKPDQRAIEAQIDKMAGLHAGLQKSRVATLFEMRAMLTPEQQKKLRELREQGPLVRIRREMRERGGSEQ